MMFTDEDQEATALGHDKTLALATSCEWLQILLSHQERILDCVDVLATAKDDMAWRLQLALVQDAVCRHFGLEDVVENAGAHAVPLRAHAVIADASRRRIQRHLEALSALTIRSAQSLIERLRSDLEDHFFAEESRSYRPLARQQSDAAKAALARLCGAVVAGSLQ